MSTTNASSGLTKKTSAERYLESFWMVIKNVLCVYIQKVNK